MARRSRNTGGYVLRNGLFVPSLIKSIQRGTISFTDLSESATITAVNIANTRLKFLGDRISAGSDGSVLARIALADATTVTATRGDDGSGTTKVVGYEVVEHYPGIIRSIQRGTISLAGAATSNTATITAVNTAKAEVTYLGVSGDSTASQDSMQHASVTLTDSTTVTATRVTGVGTIVVSYEVIEWF